MGTIAEKLARLQQTKEGIGNAIVAMGGAVPDGEPFSSYPDLIRAIPPVTKLPSGIYTVTMENPTPERGTITPGGYVSRKMQITITATPNAGYRFVSWLRYAGKATTPTLITAPTHTFPVTTNFRFIASFEADS